MMPCYTNCYEMNCHENGCALEAKAPAPHTVTPEMALAGARSIGKSIKEMNHTVRAQLCYEAMERVRFGGEMEAKPE